MSIKRSFRQVETALEKRFPTLSQKVLTRIFNAKGEITKQEGDPTADPAVDVIFDIRPFTPDLIEAIRRNNYRLPSDCEKYHPPIGRQSDGCA